VPVPGIEGFGVRITRDAQRCVAFIGFPDPSSPGGINCAGTGFFISHEGMGYFVTAAHVARTIEDSPFAVRVMRNGRAMLLENESPLKWTYHSDPTVDVAALPLLLPPELGFEHPYTSSDMLVTGDFLGTERQIGVGDICYTVGLFRLVYGNQQNLPFVHVGNLAVMPPPGERIPVWNKTTGKRSLFDRESRD
jgi:hypothetical protein